MNGGPAVKTEIDDMLAETSQAMAKGRRSVAGALADEVAVEICRLSDQGEWKALAICDLQSAVLLAAEGNERPTLTQVQVSLRHMKDMEKLSEGRIASYRVSFSIPLADECLSRAIRFGGPVEARRAGLVQTVEAAALALKTASQALSAFDQAHGF